MKIYLINHTDSPVRIKKDPETGVMTVEVGAPGIERSASIEKVVRRASEPSPPESKAWQEAKKNVSGSPVDQPQSC